MKLKNSINKDYENCQAILQDLARLKTLEGTLDPSKCETLAMALLDYERYSVEDNLIERVLNLCLADLAEIKSKAGAW